jgi:hypothetical protein
MSREDERTHIDDRPEWAQIETVEQDVKQRGQREQSCPEEVHRQLRPMSNCQLRTRGESGVASHMSRPDSAEEEKRLTAKRSGDLARSSR